MFKSNGSEKEKKGWKWVVSLETQTLTSAAKLPRS